MPVLFGRKIIKSIGGLSGLPAHCRALAAGLLLSTASIATAVPAAKSADGNTGGDDFRMVSHVIAGGGISSADGGCFSLAATIGQPLVGRVSGGDFVVTAGFWTTPHVSDEIFENGFQNEVCTP